jgi:hypothetical protein
VTLCTFLDVLQYFGGTCSFPVDIGKRFLLNVGSHSPDNMASYPRTVESCLCCLISSHIYTKYQENTARISLICAASYILGVCTKMGHKIVVLIHSF